MDPFAKKMIQGSFAFLAAMLLMLAALSAVYFHTHLRCSDDVLTQVPSPDGRWIAAVMRQRCGEEAPFIVHVNLRPSGSPLRFGFFSGRALQGQVFAAEQDAPEIIPQVTWTSSGELHITCASCRDPHRERGWGPVNIR